MRPIAVILILVLLVAAVAVNSASTGRKLMLNVISPPLAHSDSNVDHKLVRYLTGESDLRVTIVTDSTDGQPAFPDNYHDIDSLMEWGREVGARFVMVVEVTAERLEKRKSFHVPLVFHKYETVGVIEGEFRLVDLSRDKLLTAEPFKLESKAARIFQATMDDDINDPDLHLTAPNKVIFFDGLEDDLCQHLARRVRQLAGRR
ncbi:MAG: hypothetical protein JSV52_15535 [Candidatus Zixiibacteriota bacterium]|nr:MAG: hypothetical protein JSV52_15535 [candidate division Zixibacteria bacterium]